MTSEDIKKSEYQINKINCPVCDDNGARVISHLLDIPYYEDFLMLNISCSKCGYRSSDFRNMTEKDHIRMSYYIEDIEDDTTKVVRASAGTVTIPEIGIAIEPYTEGSTWIRNIEGILEDIKGKLKITIKQAEDNETRKEAQKRMRNLDKMLRYEKPFTIIVEDPTGNSVILPAKVEKLKKEIIS